MNELMTKSLAQIVNSDHRAATVFEKYDLDFCCKGKRSLEQACNEKQLPVTEVATELKNLLAKNGTENLLDFENLALGALVDYIIQTHHAYVKKELPQIFGYLEKVASKHSDRHPELIKIFQLFAAVKEEMEGHMKKEEIILFPRIKELEKHVKGEPERFGVNITYLQSPITIMEQEHDHAGTLLYEIRTLTNNYTPPEDACTTYKLSFAALQAFELDLHQHVHLENNILFPKAITAFRELKETTLN
jgi:regulator of cell morphogenesis and NO signaling